MRVVEGQDKEQRHRMYTLVVLYCYWWRVLHIILYYIIYLYIIRPAQPVLFFGPRRHRVHYVHLYTYILYYIIIKYIIIRSLVECFFKRKQKKLFNPSAFISVAAYPRSRRRLQQACQPTYNNNNNIMQVILGRSWVSYNSIIYIIVFLSIKYKLLMYSGQAA